MQLTKYGSNLYQVLFCEVVSGVNLEDEDVVNPRRPPSIDVDSNEEEEDDDEEGAPEEPENYLHIVTTPMEDT